MGGVQAESARSSASLKGQGGDAKTASADDNSLGQSLHNTVRLLGFGADHA
jgi:hypothetical protein